jgi:hypothetical protein
VTTKRCSSYVSWSLLLLQRREVQTLSSRVEGSGHGGGEKGIGRREKVRITVANDEGALNKRGTLFYAPNLSRPFYDGEPRISQGTERSGANERAGGWGALRCIESSVFPGSPIQSHQSIIIHRSSRRQLSHALR